MENSLTCCACEMHAKYSAVEVLSELPALHVYSQITVSSVPLGGGGRGENREQSFGEISRSRYGTRLGRDAT
jgi:hypothetical protein